ncbi:MAG: hypothetical protein KKF20_07440 [Bacteroidetes bacterium]|nr:hypothetical protein [Bacteroidota bacterium]MBU1422758.1 hypothetical protein [Bacteroidota bacterium]MBU2472226.1 hypothetical protein [Bacteroidota bacterium]
MEVFFKCVTQNEKLKSSKTALAVTIDAGVKDLMIISTLLPEKITRSEQFCQHKYSF